MTDPQVISRAYIARQTDNTYRGPALAKSEPVRVFGLHWAVPIPAGILAVILTILEKLP